jgi:hypothetical protein
MISKKHREYIGKREGESSKPARPKRFAKNSKPGKTHLPDKIRIRREAGYHTSSIGTTKSGDQFMGFIVGVEPGLRKSSKGLSWYAVVHRFDSDGKHLKTDSHFLGTKAWAHELEGADARLSEMIARMGPVKYSDVIVRPFSVEIDGQTFGLIDRSEPTKGYLRIDLVPNNLAFFPPWDGFYDT